MQPFYHLFRLKLNIHQLIEPVEVSPNPRHRFSHSPIVQIAKLNKRRYFEGYVIGVQFLGTRENRGVEKMKERLKKEIENVVKKHNLSLVQVILFGSRARGDYTPESDWDIVVVLKEPLNSRERKSLWLEIYKNLHRRFSGNSFDIFIKSKDEFDSEKRFANTIASESVEKGIAL